MTYCIVLGNIKYTVESPWTPLSLATIYPKHQTFCSQIPIIIELAVNDHPALLSNRNQFLAWQIYFPLFLTSFRRSLDAWCDLCHGTILRNLEISCNNWLSQKKIRCVGACSWKRPPVCRFSQATTSCKRPATSSHFGWSPTGVS